MFAHQFFDQVVVNHAGAFGVDRDVDRVRHADGVRHLDLALTRQPGGHDVLGHIARGVGGAAVDFGRILSAESATAVRTGAAVGVHDDLASGQAAVALRTANHEAAGRIDQVLRVFQPLRWNHRLDDAFHHGFDERGFHRVAHTHLGAVLAGNDNGLHAVRAAIHIAHGDLRLGIGAQKRQSAVLAQFGLALHQAVGVVDRCGHQLGRFIAGIAEHHALVAGSGIQAIIAGVIDALGDVGALLVVGYQHRAALVVDAELGVVVAYGLDRVARDLNVVDVGVLLGADLACQHYQAGVG